MKSVLVTGGNRGLGLEWVRQYAGEGWRVYATCRDPDAAEGLRSVAATHPYVSVHRLDVTDAGAVAGIRSDLSDSPLDLLINNAGVYHERWGRDRLGSIDYWAWEESFRVNVLGAARVTEALLVPLARSGRGLVVAISSHMGCIGDIASPNDYAYRSSKAALNATFHGMAYELAQEHIGVLLLHPGWVRTRMGGDAAPIEVGESVRGMRELVARFDASRSGRLYKHDGRELPW